MTVKPLKIINFQQEIKLISQYDIRGFGVHQITGALGKPSFKKNIFLLTFVNKDFTPPLIIDEKPLRFGGPVRGVTPPFIKVKNNIV